MIIIKDNLDNVSVKLVKNKFNFVGKLFNFNSRYIDKKKLCYLFEQCENISPENSLYLEFNINLKDSILENTN